MEKINFIIFLSILIPISYSQLTDDGLSLNNQRKLKRDKREIVLLGFDNYTIPDSSNDYVLSFNAYFLFKNWNYTLYPFDNLKSDPFYIDSFINYTKNGYDIGLNCTYDDNKDLSDSKYDDDEDQYVYIKYKCRSERINYGIPKGINLRSNFSDLSKINGCEIYVSPSLEVFQNDLINSKNKNLLKDGYISVLTNATFVSQSPSSFIIRGNYPKPYFNRIPNEYYYEHYDDFVSNNIQLFTNSYGYPRKVPCSGKYQKDNSDDNEYYYLETKGSNILSQSDLKYAIAKVTSKNTIFLIDFQENENSIIYPKITEKKSSGGLSTGGMIAIIIPSCIVLLGTVGLVFFISRGPLPHPPTLVKNLPNTTLGVASSQAVVNQ